MSGWSVNLTALFLGRLIPPKRLTRTSCFLALTLYNCESEIVIQSVSLCSAENLVKKVFDVL